MFPTWLKGNGNDCFALKMGSGVTSQLMHQITFLPVLDLKKGKGRGYPAL